MDDQSRVTWMTSAGDRFALAVFVLGVLLLAAGVAIWCRGIWLRQALRRGAGRVCYFEQTAHQPTDNLSRNETRSRDAAVKSAKGAR